MDALRRNHFELLGLPTRYLVDGAALEQSYRNLQVAVHPDRFASGTPQERRLAVQLAAQVNEAYRCLKDPVRRAVYLCELAGLSVGEHTNTAMPLSFLQEQMVWRETLQDLRDASDRDGLQSLAATIRLEREQRIDRLRATLDDENDSQAAVAQVRQLMFVDRFMEQIGEALDSLA